MDDCLFRKRLSAIMTILSDEHDRERGVEGHTVKSASEAAAKAIPRPLERTIADLNPRTKRPVFIEIGRSWFVQTRPRWKSSAGVLGSQESEKTLSWAAKE